MRGVLSPPDAKEADLVEKARAVPVDGGARSGYARIHGPQLQSGIEGVEPVSKSERIASAGDPLHHVVAYDFGIKRNILRKLVQSGTKVTVVPALTPAEDVMRA